MRFLLPDAERVLYTIRRVYIVRDDSLHAVLSGSTYDGRVGTPLRLSCPCRATCCSK